jgi:hypothetical protein
MNEQKCIAKGCEAWGCPPEGYHFFICESCLEELDVAIMAFAVLHSLEALA